MIISRVLLSVMVFVCLVQASMASYAKKQSTSSEYNFVYNLPLNVMNDKGIALQATPPSSFKPVSDMEFMISSGLVEYIPENEAVENSSEIIGFFAHYIGKGLQAKQIINAMSNSFKLVAQNIQVLRNEAKIVAGCEEEDLLLFYTLNGNPELLWVYVVSGPMDSAMVQYTIRLPQNISVDELYPFIKKIVEYKKKHIKIITEVKVKDGFIVP